MIHTRLACAIGLALALLSPPAARAQQGPIKIGVMLDHTGPFAAAGSLASYRGTRLIIDMVNEKGGVWAR